MVSWYTGSWKKGTTKTHSTIRPFIHHRSLRMGLCRQSLGCGTDNHPPIIRTLKTQRKHQKPSHQYYDHFPREPGLGCSTSVFFLHLFWKELLLLLHPLISLFSRPAWVSRHQKGKPFWVLLEQEMMGVAVASAGPYANHLHLAPDKQHASTPPLSFYKPDTFPAAQPTASKHWRHSRKGSLLENNLWV